MDRQISHSNIRILLIVFILVSLVTIGHNRSALAEDQISIHKIESMDQATPQGYLLGELHATTTFTQISGGIDRTCGLTSAGGVKCWGWGYSDIPTDVMGLTSGVQAVADGGGHTCVLTEAGGVKCWGANGAGQLGNGTYADSNIPVDVSGLQSGVKAIAVGFVHTCALTSSDGVKCWGAGSSGQLGNGSTSGSPTPVNVSGLTSGVAWITAGEAHSCAITTSGVAKCWGGNYVGELGDGTTTRRTTPVDVIGLTGNTSMISAGSSHTCAITTSGGAKCWGGNWLGQLGDGSTEDRYTPVDVSGLASGVASISADYDFTCAITSTGGLKCWGSNSYGNLGDGTMLDTNVPMNVVGLTSGVSEIGTGYFHACAITSSGSTYCWGSNSNGQLADGNESWRSIPMEINDPGVEYTMLSAGDSITCGVTSMGGAKCWGLNYSGQLGDGTQVDRSQPEYVHGLSSGVNSVSTGFDHSCAVTTSGGAKCWGENFLGQLGDGTKTDRFEPVDVVGLSSGVQAVVAGYGVSCALTDTGAVKCWGNGTSVPSDVSGLSSGVEEISGGEEDHFCVLMDTGGVKCWGANDYGQLGNGSTDSNYHKEPVDVVGLASGVSSVGLGVHHSCAVLDDGSAKCWGANDYGQLGDGTSVDSNIPVDVTAFTGQASKIGGGLDHTCIVSSAGELQCWGGNYQGQLGNGSALDSLTAVDTSGMSDNVTSVSPGYTHTCAIAAGRGKCWGSDSYGELGLSRPITRLTPTLIVETLTASLVISHPSGSPGSYFTVTGSNFPPNGTVALSVNGELLAGSISSNETGGFVVFLDTGLSDPGWYSVTVSYNPSVTTGFVLDPGLPQRLQEGGGTTLDVPAGISGNEATFLPLLNRK